MRDIKRSSGQSRSVLHARQWRIVVILSEHAERERVSKIVDDGIELGRVAKRLGGVRLKPVVDVVVTRRCCGNSASGSDRSARYVNVHGRTLSVDQLLSVGDPALDEFVAVRCALLLGGRTACKFLNLLSHAFGSLSNVELCQQLLLVLSD
jgi:hypothetical protein